MSYEKGQVLSKEEASEVLGIVLKQIRDNADDEYYQQLCDEKAIWLSGLHQEIPEVVWHRTGAKRVGPEWAEYQRLKNKFEQ